MRMRHMCFASALVAALTTLPAEAAAEPIPVNTADTPGTNAKRISTAAARHPLVIQLGSGRIGGATEGGIDSWKGVPFAAAPIGPLRWRAPVPVKSWNGVRAAIAYQHDCMQLPFPSDAAPLGTSPAEDCLYANIWRPAGTRPGQKLPVIVWIYGGGFVNGGSSPPTYSGANLAKQGAVVVSFNYRLGRFGTFLLPQMSRESGTTSFTGNFGFLDQIAALNWVKANAAAFGGDPGNVTIVGESAGGMSVHMLLTSPAATGLFAKGVIMSGGDGTLLGGNDPSIVERTSQAFAMAKGVSPSDPRALAKLRALSADDVTAGLNLTALFDSAAKPLPFSSPYADGHIVVDVRAAYASGTFPRVPIMIGATNNDIGGRTGLMVTGARWVERTLSDLGVPVFAYRFSYVASSVSKSGASHASDIPFFFDTVSAKYGDGATMRDRTVGHLMSTYLVNFARSGDPNGTGLPVWRRFTRTNDEIIDFAADGRAMPGPDPWSADNGPAGK